MFFFLTFADVLVVRDSLFQETKKTLWVLSRFDSSTPRPNVFPKVSCYCDEHTDDMLVSAALSPLQ